MERGECLWEGVSSSGQLISSKEQVNTAHQSISNVLHAVKKQEHEKSARRQKTKPMFKRGISGLPLSVEQIMLEERYHNAVGMGRELVRMRQESLHGEKYWEPKKEPVKSDDSLETGSEYIHLFKLFGRRKRGSDSCRGGVHDQVLILLAFAPAALVLLKKASKYQHSLRQVARRGFHTKNWFPRLLMRRYSCERGRRNPQVAAGSVLQLCGLQPGQ